MNRISTSGIRILIASALLGAGTFVVQAQDSTTKPPDNTAVNKRDRSQAAPTADNQKDNRSDRTTTQKIRQAIVADKSLSTYAHNVKIITKGGAVTLKGPVRSEEEKSTIEAKAKEVAGADKVTNQISVAPGKKSKS